MLSKKSSRILVSLVLTICLICSILGGCAPSATPAPSFTATPAPSATPAQPEIQLSSYGETAVPSIQNFAADQQVNEALYTYFTSLIDALPEQTASYELTYALDVLSNSSLVLHSAIQHADSAGNLPLPDISISPSGAQLPDTGGLLPALSDSAFLDAGILLSACQIPVDITRYGENGTNEQLLDLLIQAYESLTKEPVDDSQIIAEITNPVFRKAYALGIDSYIGSEPTVMPLSNEMVLMYLSAFIREFQGNELGLASQTATVQDAIDLIEGDFDKCLVGQGVPQDGAAKDLMSSPESTAPLPSISNSPQEVHPSVIQGRKAVDCTAIAKSASLELDAPLDRQTLAKLVVCIYENQTDSEIAIDPNAWNFIDTEDESCLKAVNAYLLDFYPTADMFSPDFPIRMNTLPMLVEPLITNVQYARYQDNSEEVFHPLTYGQMVYIMGDLLGDYQSIQTPELQRVEVVNDREYDWYYSQNDTGEYSLINCMPTCCAMAMKWQNPNFSDSVESLRNAYPENTMGWYMYDVENTLDRYHVSYDPNDFFLESELIPMMLEDLDQGCILFCQFNDHDISVDGHCFIVYGYRKIGDSLWFLVNDPDGLGPDAFGKDMNQGKWIEGQYAQWIISRFSTRYLAIAPVKVS